MTKKIFLFFWLSLVRVSCQNINASYRVLQCESDETSLFGQSVGFLCLRILNALAVPKTELGFPHNLTLMEALCHNQEPTLTPTPYHVCIIDGLNLAWSFLTLTPGDCGCVVRVWPFFLLTRQQDKAYDYLRQPYPLPTLLAMLLQFSD